MVDEFEPVGFGGAFEPEEFAVFDDLGLEHFAPLVFDAVDGRMDVFQQDVSVDQGLQLDYLVCFLEDHEDILVVGAAVTNIDCFGARVVLAVVENHLFLLLNHPFLLINHLEHIMRQTFHRV